MRPLRLSIAAVVAAGVVLAVAAPAWANDTAQARAADNPAAGTATAIASSRTVIPAGPAPAPAITPARAPTPAPVRSASLPASASAPVVHYCSNLGSAGSVVNQELGSGGSGPGSWTGYLCATGDIFPSGAVPYRLALRGNISAPSFMLAWTPKSPAHASRAAPVAPVAKVVVVSPQVLISRAVRSVRVPSPGRVGLSPGGSGWTVPNFPTWLWVDPAAWHPVTARASAGPVTATVTATPSGVRWSMGDGSATTCAGPGTPYVPSRPAASQSTACSWTYRHHTGAMTVTATVTWRVTWSVAGAPGGAKRAGTLAPLSASSSAAVTVRPVESLVSGG